MRTMHGTRGGGERGWALVFAVFVAFVAASMSSLMFLDSLTSHRVAMVNQRRAEASYRAEGAVEAGKKAVQVAIASWAGVPAGGTVAIGGVAIPYTVAPTGYQETVTDPSGIQSQLTGYEISATAERDGIQATVHRIITTEATPIFQFAVFYSDDLEILPGPSMTLGGRVHSNADIYLGCGNTLTVDTNYCRAVGDMYRVRKNDPTQSSGTVRIRRWVADPFDIAEPVQYFAMNSISQMAALGVATESGYDSAFTAGYDEHGDGDFDEPNDWLPFAPGALEYWSEPDGYAGGTGTTVMTGEHGVQEAVTPDIGSIAMFEPSAGGDYVWDGVAGEYVAVAPGIGDYAKGFFHATAGLVLIAHEDGTWQAEDGDGTDVTAAVAGAVRTKSLYDARQGGAVQVIEVNVGLLNASGKFPANGLLYAASYGNGEGTDCKGVELVNGAELLAPLTTVTEGAIYVKGDYNSTSKKGSAVIADAVNLLSNAWNDTKSGGTLPAASNTTYNLAFISGNHETVGSSYNGGLENLPRFHENWSGRNCVLTGSFVNTWFSFYATGTWVYGGDRYQAPVRLWSYDEDFNDVANLPPFTPMVVSAHDVAVW
ncbi:MAG: hypothetical protein AB1726_11380 [Planctomycetota bacterium]